MSWREAIQRRDVERERVLFDAKQQLWPKPDLSVERGEKEGEEGEESGEEAVDLEAEPARTSYRKDKPLKTFGGDRSQTLTPGTYTYHLKWKLPHNIPLSFEDESSAKWMESEGAMVPKMLTKGHTFIRYHATATLLISHPQKVKPPTISSPASMDAPSTPAYIIQEVPKKITARKAFKVLEDIPLAALSTQPPLYASSEKTFLFGSPDMPLRLSITLEHGGIAFIGSTFFATIGIDNKSNRTVDSVRIGIDCITTFRVAPPTTPPVLAGLAGSQVQSIMDPKAPSKANAEAPLAASAAAGTGAVPLASSQAAGASPEYIENVTRKENVLNTTLAELTNIEGGGGAASKKASRISVTLPSFWAGSIVTAVHVERRYELYAECIVTMGTNLITRCPLRLLEWCPFFNTVLPHLSPSPVEPELDEFDISDDSDNEARTQNTKSEESSKPLTASSSLSSTPTVPSETPVASSSQAMD